MATPGALINDARSWGRNEKRHNHHEPVTEIQPTGGEGTFHYAFGNVGEPSTLPRNRTVDAQKSSPARKVTARAS